MILAIRYLVIDMNRSEKDKKEKKLRAFLKEWETLEFSTGKDELDHLKKKYGFTEDDWHRAIKLTMSISNKDQYWKKIGYKKLNQIAKDKSLFKSEDNLNSEKQKLLDEIGEKSIEAEDAWIMDVFGNEYYDPEEDSHR